MDTGELKSAPLSAFPSDKIFVLCRDRHLHFLSFHIPTHEEENPQPSNTMNVPEESECRKERKCKKFRGRY